METIEEIQTKANRFESEYINLKQEFKKYIETSQKNEQRKKQEMIANKSKKLLVVADSLDRISRLNKESTCNTASDYSENVQKNIEAIYNQMLSVSDLISINPAKGDRFDEQKHMAVGLEHSTVYPDNSIFRVIRKGYTLEDSVVRPAEVIVIKSPVDKKVIKPGLWTRLLRFFRSTKHHFYDINQKINELELRQKDYLSKLEVDTQMLQDTINELDDRTGKIEDVEVHQEELTGKMLADIQMLQDAIIELDEKTGKIEDVGAQQEELTEKMATNMQMLQDAINELDERTGKTEDVGAQQEELTEKMAVDMQMLQDAINELDERTGKTEDVGAQQEKMIGKNVLDTDPLIEPVHELNDNIQNEETEVIPVVHEEDRQIDELESIKDEDTEEFMPDMSYLIDPVREPDDNIQNEETEVIPVVHEEDRQTDELESIKDEDTEEFMPDISYLIDPVRELKENIHKEETEDISIVHEEDRQTNELESIKDEDIEEFMPDMGSLINAVNELSEKVVQTYALEHSTQHNIEKATSDMVSRNNNIQENASLNLNPNLHLPEIYEVIPDINKEKTEETKPTPRLHKEEASSGLDMHIDENNKNNSN